MIDAKAWVFCKLYELLRDKFIKEFAPKYDNDKVRDSLKLWTDEKFREKEHPFFGQNKAHTIFDINEKGDYFYEKYQLALTNPDTVSIKEHRIFKALRYINDPEPWTPEKHAKYPKLSTEKLNNEAKRLYDEFERKLIKDTKSERLDENRKIEIENKLLSLIEQDLKNFSPPRITKLLRNFFNALKAKNYHEAWLLLTPEMQKESVWNNSYHNFKTSFYNIEAFDKVGFSNFWYKDRTVKFDLSYCEHGYAHDLSYFFDFIKSDTINEKDQLQIILRDIRDKFNNFINNRGTSLSDFSIQHFWDIDTQKLFFFFLNESYYLNDYKHLFGKMDKVIAETKVEASCLFFEGKWLISDLGGFNLSSRKGYLERWLLPQRL